jgi:catalase
MFLFSDRGTPRSYREMNGYSSHTLKWVNAKNEAFWVKVHYKPEAGVKNFTAAEAQQMCGADPDHATRDLFNHIAGGKAAEWSMQVQIMPVADAKKYKWNVFDVTKVWPHTDYPLQKVGKMVLNRNPANYFAEVEQSAFSPSHMVPGIEPSFDRMLQGRLFSYPDTHRHRLGVNYHQIPINCPYASAVRNTQRDGAATVNGNQGSAPNFEPNSIAGTPKADKVYAQHKFTVEDAAIVARHAQQHPNSDFEQPHEFYHKVLSEQDRANLVSNIAGNLKGAKKALQQRVINEYFGQVDKGFAARIAEAIQKSSL